ncbi:MAG: PPOX class F420-dependent oxidoreductase [Actinomycetota bacterium]|nr:PPOX class F420-dependent oxidoreductase [Actinomycetota bacterium]
MLIPDSHADILDKQAFASVATIGPNGEPQNNPVWFGWDGSRIRFSQTTTRQKYRNTRTDRRVSLSILDPDDPYRYLEIRGVVVDVEDDGDLAFINSMASKYLGLDRYPWHQPTDERIVIVVQPTHTTTMG